MALAPHIQRAETDCLRYISVAFSYTAACSTTYHHWDWCAQYLLCMTTCCWYHYFCYMIPCCSTYHQCHWCAHSLFSGWTMMDQTGLHSRNGHWAMTLSLESIPAHKTVRLNIYKSLISVEMTHLKKRYNIPGINENADRNLWTANPYTSTETDKYENSKGQSCVRLRRYQYMKNWKLERKYVWGLDKNSSLER